MSDAPRAPEPEPDDEIDETVVIGVPAGTPAPPEDDDELDGTIVVDRSRPDAGFGPDDDADGVDRTIVVDRGHPDDGELDRTIVVDRGADSDVDRTVVVERGETDRTVVIPDGRIRAVGIPDPAPTRRRTARRMRITLPDDTPVSERASEGPGVGAVERYEARAIPAPPDVEILPAGPEATRAPAPGMPSVARASRRAGRRALLIAAAACVVGIAGLIAIGVVVFGG